MTLNEKAQQGKGLILEAIVEVLKRSSPHPVRHTDIVDELGLHSEYKGGNRNYLTGSLLDELERKGVVAKEQERPRGPMRYRLLR